MFNKGNKNYKYSIRKYTVGVASVAVAAFVFLGTNAEAKAAEAPGVNGSSLLFGVVGTQGFDGRVGGSGLSGNSISSLSGYYGGSSLDGGYSSFEYGPYYNGGYGAGTLPTYDTDGDNEIPGKDADRNGKNDSTLVGMSGAGSNLSSSGRNDNEIYPRLDVAPIAPEVESEEKNKTSESDGKVREGDTRVLGTSHNGNVEVGVEATTDGADLDAAAKGTTKVGDTRVLGKSQDGKVEVGVEATTDGADLDKIAAPKAENETTDSTGKNRVKREGKEAEVERSKEVIDKTRDKMKEDLEQRNLSESEKEKYRKKFDDAKTIVELEKVENELSASASEIDSYLPRDREENSSLKAYGDQSGSTILRNEEALRKSKEKALDLVDEAINNKVREESIKNGNKHYINENTDWDKYEDSLNKVRSDYSQKIIKQTSIPEVELVVRMFLDQVKDMNYVENNKKIEDEKTLIPQPRVEGKTQGDIPVTSEEKEIPQGKKISDKEIQELKDDLLNRLASLNDNDIDKDRKEEIRKKIQKLTTIEQHSDLENEISDAIVDYIKSRTEKTPELPNEKGQGNDIRKDKEELPQGDQPRAEEKTSETLKTESKERGEDSKDEKNQNDVPKESEEKTQNDKPKVENTPKPEARVQDEKKIEDTEEYKKLTDQKQKDFAEKFDKELKYQKEKIGKMTGLTEEERKTALEKLESIKKETLKNLIDKKTKDQIEELRKKVVEDLGKNLITYKSYTEGLLNEYTNKLLEPLKNDSEKSVEYEKLLEEVRKAEIEGFEKIDKSTKNDDVDAKRKETEEEIKKIVEKHKEDSFKYVGKKVEETEEYKQLKEENQKKFARNLDEELVYQKDKINRMKTLIDEERKAALEQLKKIKEDTLKALIDKKTDKDINDLRDEVIRKLGNSLVTYKSYTEKLVNEYANKLLEPFKVEREKKDAETSKYEKLVEEVRKVEKEGFDKIDEATTKELVDKNRKEIEEKIKRVIEEYKNPNSEVSKENAEVTKYKTMLQESIQKLQNELNTVPDGGVTIDDDYKKVEDLAKAAIKKAQEVLSKSGSRAEELAKEDSAIKEKISELKEAKDRAKKLAEEKGRVQPSPKPSGKDDTPSVKPSVPGASDEKKEETPSSKPAPQTPSKDKEITKGDEKKDEVAPAKPEVSKDDIQKERELLEFKYKRLEWEANRVKTSSKDEYKDKVKNAEELVATTKEVILKKDSTLEEIKSQIKKVDELTKELQKLPSIIQTEPTAPEKKDEKDDSKKEDKPSAQPESPEQKDESKKPEQEQNEGKKGEKSPEQNEVKPSTPKDEKPEQEQNAGKKDEETSKTPEKETQQPSKPAEPTVPEKKDEMPQKDDSKKEDKPSMHQEQSSQKDENKKAGQQNGKMKEEQNKKDDKKPANTTQQNNKGEKESKKEENKKQNSMRNDVATISKQELPNTSAKNLAATLLALLALIFGLFAAVGKIRIK